MNSNPSWRKPAGMLLILTIIAVWAIAVASCAPWISGLPGWLQAVLYTVTGIIWIMPMKPLLLWMETGRWRV